MAAPSTRGPRGAPRARVRLGVALLLAYAGLTVAPLVGSQLELRAAPDPEAAWRAQLPRLRQQLPQRGRVGFVGEPSPDLAKPATTARFFRAQYELAPLVLDPWADPGAAPGLVVGIFGDSAAGRAAAARLGLRTLEDFGGGLFLFERPVP